MQRAPLRELILALTVLATACTHSPPTSIDRNGATEWLAVGYPAIVACTECHAGGHLDATPFLAGATPSDVRLTLLSFMPTIVRIDEPVMSPLLTKGHHEGLALTADETSDLLSWLYAEQAP